jgi:hypothetical protein
VSPDAVESCAVELPSVTEAGGPPPRRWLDDGASPGSGPSKLTHPPAAASSDRCARERSGTLFTHGAPSDKGARLVGLAAAAAYADVSTRTLRRYIAHGRLTGYASGHPWSRST